MDQFTLLESAIFACVIIVQLACFFVTWRRCAALKRLFPDSEPQAVILKSTMNERFGDEPVVEATRIEPGEECSVGFERILESTNDYLSQNSDSVADFHIMQDIAERVSETAESAAAGNASLPLYIGLMGTFIGVIVGLLNFVAFQASLDDPGAFTDPGHLRHFVGGVLIAMAGSLCGLLLSVLARAGLLHRAQLKNSRLRQAYFTLLQTKLLPVVGHDLSSALKTLGQNLLHFNSDFSANLTTFGEATGTAVKSLNQQRELIDILKSTEILKVIEANADMLRNGEAISRVLREVATETEALQDKLKLTGQLTDKFNALLDRFGIFEQNVNLLGEKLAVDNTVVARTVELIEAQLKTLRNSTDVVRQYAAEKDGDIKRLFDSQRAELGRVAESVKQDLDALSSQIASYVANALKDGEGTAFVNNVARLKNIDEQINALVSSAAELDPVGKGLGRLDAIDESVKALSAALLDMRQTGRTAENSILTAIRSLPRGMSSAMAEQIGRLASSRAGTRRTSNGPHDWGPRPPNGASVLAPWWKFWVRGPERRGTQRPEDRMN